MTPELWLRIHFPGFEPQPHYEVSNWGRLKSYQRSKRGVLIDGSVIQGYRTLNVRQRGVAANLYVHKLVANFFCERISENHIYSIHMDHDKLNNWFENIRLVTKQEMFNHRCESQGFINRIIPRRTKNYKLTESKVVVIKRLISNGNCRMKSIAKHFKVSQTQLKRIRSGENWKHVKIDDPS